MGKKIASRVADLEMEDTLCSVTLGLPRYHVLVLFWLFGINIESKSQG